MVKREFLSLTTAYTPSFMSAEMELTEYFWSIPKQKLEIKSRNSKYFIILTYVSIQSAPLAWLPAGYKIHEDSYIRQD
jgi:hypothetical protein